MASIKQQAGVLSDKREAKALRELLESVLADNDNLRTAVTGLTAKLDVLTAKLNADAGVTDTDYATDFASTLDPAPLTLTE